MRGRSLPYRESGTYGVLAHAGDEAGRGVRERPGGGDRREAPARRQRLARRTRPPTPTSSAGTWASSSGVDAGAEASDREALFYSIREFLEAVAREQPTILVFEDVHWADDNMLDLIGALATRVRALPILFVTLARPELLDLRADWGSGLAGYTAADPRPARRSRTRVSWRCGGSASGAQAEEVIRVAEGNPLFIEQLAASIGEMPPGTLPTNVREIVAARLDALPPAERALLLDAAVVGKVFWLDALRSHEHAATAT